MSLPGAAGGVVGSPSPRSGVGAWLFRQRSWLPVPGALVLILVRAGETRRASLVVLGLVLLLVGVGIRAWAVRHIGSISRTRAGRIGPLVTTGPYAITRNPLYVANAAIWTGLVLCSKLLWMLPVAWTLFALQYVAIVRYEEAALLQIHGDNYVRYRASVSRWWPRWTGDTSRDSLVPWRDVLFSERGTLIAVGCMATLLVVKDLLGY